MPLVCESLSLLGRQGGKKGIFLLLLMLCLQHAEAEPYKKEELLVASRGRPEEIVPIAKCQEASGAWKVDALLSFFPDAKALLAERPAELADEVVWSTALAIAYLMKKRPDDECTWSLLVQKARVFVRKFAISKRIIGRDFVQDALKLVF